MTRRKAEEIDMRREHDVSVSARNGEGDFTKRDILAFLTGVPDEARVSVVSHYSGSTIYASWKEKR